MVYRCHARATTLHRRALRTPLPCLLKVCAKRTEGRGCLTPRRMVLKTRARSTVRRGAARHTRAFPYACAGGVAFRRQHAARGHARHSSTCLPASLQRAPAAAPFSPHACRAQHYSLGRQQSFHCLRASGTGRTAGGEEGPLVLRLDGIGGRAGQPEE